MFPFESFVCCGGRRFVHVPLIGLLESSFVLVTFTALAAVAAFVWRLRRYLVFVVALLAAAVGVAWKTAVDRTTTEGGVKGWLQALDMARVDADSDAFGLFVQDQSSQIEMARQQKNSAAPSQPALGRGPMLQPVPPPHFDLSKFDVPARVSVLSAEEAAEATALLLDDKDHWIHMDRRTGPLPSFIYGTYYQYNSHGMDFPTPKSVSAARLAWLKAGAVEPPMNGVRATSTVAYADPLHGAQAYNHRQRQVLGRNPATGRGLDLHERLRAAVANATGMEVVFDENWGLPGAQITFSHRVMEYEVFQAHIDGSWSPIVQGLTECVPQHRLSVTLTLQTPSSGAGLDLWVFDRTKPGCTDQVLQQASTTVQAWNWKKRQQLERGARLAQAAAAGDTSGGAKQSRSDDEFSAAADRRALENDVSGALLCLDRRVKAYTAGEAIVHSGAVIHALAPWKYRGAGYDEARVTVQGFAFLCSGKWHLHW